MTSIRFLLAILVLAAGLEWTGEFLWAQNLIAKSKLGDSDYCNLKFPAISEETLRSDRPALKETWTGDLIDFYGPCNFDPTGKEAVNEQKPRGPRQRERWG
jgi:hypothetical protein